MSKDLGIVTHREAPREVMIATHREDLKEEMIANGTYNHLQWQKLMEAKDP